LADLAGSGRLCGGPPLPGQIFMRTKAGAGGFCIPEAADTFAPSKYQLALYAPKGRSFHTGEARGHRPFTLPAPPPALFWRGARDNLARLRICPYCGRMIAAISHPWSAGTLIPAEKPLFCSFSGSANFLCRRNGAVYFPSAPPGKPFSPLPPHSCAPAPFVSSAALKSMRRACLLGKNRI
jgi:hypothetical protein